MNKAKIPFKIKIFYLVTIFFNARHHFQLSSLFSLLHEIPYVITIQGAVPTLPNWLASRRGACIPRLANMVARA